MVPIRSSTGSRTSAGAELGRGLQHPSGQHVALGDDRGGPLLRGDVEQDARGRGALGHSVARGLVDRDRAEDVLDTLDAVPHVAVVRPRAALRGDRAARAVEPHGHRDDLHPPVAEVVQVAGELAGASAVVDVDQRGALDRGSLHRHDRHASRAQLPQRGVVLEAAGGEDGGVERDAGDLAGGGPADVAREQQQAHVVGAEDLADAVEQLQRHRVAERVEQPFPDERADDAAAAAAQ